MASMDKVKVAVRVRPFNRRESEMGTKCVIDMDGTQTVLFHPSTGVKEFNSDAPQHTSKKSPKPFAFDHCFWSIEECNEKFAGQDAVFQCLGTDILGRAFEGYNACIFAYGQTGSGKSYTMMGTRDEKGIIPRLCDTLFDRIASNDDVQLTHKVEVSYFEIYNEKVRDLLDPNGKHNLKVREHNILGPYVDGLSKLAVADFEDIENLMVEGNKSRTVAATNMNSESSRSHAVFNIILTQTITDVASGVSGEKVSKMSLVDLAGSERAQKTGAMGERLKEGSNINKSLSTLGLVISALADQASGRSKNKFVPYRDSVLTWLLKDNLGGNSKTVMVATLSPAADNYEETLSTLRYADRAKRIVNHAVVNEDPNARIIRELREEVEMLKTMLDEAQIMKQDTGVRERLQESEKLMKEMSKTWEEKLRETERNHLERHVALEKMGISVQTSGIKVEQGKYYLVNLNADPSLNELLVYYLKEHTLVGRQDAGKEQDIQLSGLGIVPEHCVFDIEDSEVYISPIEGARTCVNGRTITEKTKVKHGDRILWGNNHFFRINCPKSNSPSTETPENIDYDFAQQELMTQQYGDDPIQEAINSMEKQHEEDKQEALDRQRMMYERQMQMLRNQIMSPSTPSAPYPAFSPFFDPFNRMTPVGTPNSSSVHPKYQQWIHEREKLFKQSLSKLKEEVMKANTLVIEANSLAEEMGKQTEFSVTLQIPAANLSPNRKRGAFVSEPAILVKSKKKGSQIWSMDKFENKIIDMRDMYQERKDKGLPMMVNDEPFILRLDGDGPPIKGDPFHESQENHNLIGVANIFLETLFYDVKLDYHVPIVSQQGEVAGRLHIELCRVSGTLPDRLQDDVSSESSGEGSNRNSFVEIDDETGVAVGSTIVCRIGIKEARGLPPALSNFVFCQYTYWGYPEPMVVPPMVEAEVLQKKKSDGMSFKFDHSKEFTVHVTEEFMEHCAEGALSIEVWGHRSTGFGTAVPGWELDQVQAKSRSIMDRWSELTRKMEMWVEIHELNEQGEYMPVEVAPRPEVLTGGVFQLRQGHSRRILVQVKPVSNSGTLPIICESINHVSIGCVCARSKLQKGLDSYQEEDLAKLREKWSEALEKRREYLDEQLQKIMNKEEKNDADAERERSLIDQWVCLTEERNAVLVPAAGSGIPGAPADWAPPSGMETHIPVIFLDLNAEDMSTPNVKEGLQAAGVNSILPKEHGAKFFNLPFVKNSEKDVCAIVSWDSSIHDSVHLNRVTPVNERVYLILKAVVRLSHPASMELVLRKRISINVYKRQSLTEKLRRRIGKAVITSVTGYNSFQDTLCSSAIMYEVVSNIPKASEDLEDRESLAQIAASQNDQASSDGETYIEKYIRGVSAVESILTLDRLRQEVAIKELLAARGRPLRKSTSVPNIQNMRADSIQDLSYSDGAKQLSSFDAYRGRSASVEIAKDNSILPSKPPFSLASPKSGTQPSVLGMTRPLKTLVEEQQSNEVKPLLQRRDTEDSDEDEFAKLKDSQPEGAPIAKTTSPSKSSDGIDSDDFQEFQEFQGEKEPGEEVAPPVGSNGVPQKGATESGKTNGIVHSSTTESLVEVQAKGFAPSVTSSGYGSQAVSTHTLSSEDSLSLRSISIDDTPDADKCDGSQKSDDAAEAKSSDAAKSADEEDDNEEEKDEEKVKDTNGADRTFARSESLIDMDVPKDLDSPLQPTTPSIDSHSLDSKSLDSDRTLSDKTEVDADEFVTVSPEEAQETKPNSTEVVQDAEVLQDMAEKVVPEDVVPVVEEEKPVIVNGDEDTNAQSNETSDVTTMVEPDNDIYSENALDQLENLDDSAMRTDTGTFSTENTPVKKDKPEGVTHKEAEPKGTNGNGSNQVKLRRRGSPGIDRSQRRSWHEKSDRRFGDDSPRQQQQTPEFKLNKGPNVDLHRPGSLKKLRGTETRGGKTAPSPVKATYRPLNLDVTADDGSIDGEEREENNSDNEDTMSICSFGSRADLHRLGEAPIPSWVQPGEPVIVLFSAGSSKNGTVQFVGQTEFAAGNWVGVALDTADGKNDGSVKGVRYFKCRSRHGLFVRHDKLIMDKKRKGAKMRSMSSTLRRSTGNLSSPSPQKESAGSFMKATAASSAKKK